MAVVILGASLACQTAATGSLTLILLGFDVFNMLANSKTFQASKPAVDFRPSHPC
ncbi:MAG: hypothetical protein IJR49_02530 [Treponema sp.]|nr:hypothetical protein [Treponema sp.]